MSHNNQFLTAFIKKIFPIADNTAEVIADNFEYQQVPKHSFLLEAGKVNSDYVFLQSGFIRSFVYDIDGNEVTTNIFKQNSVVFEVSSYFRRKPSNEYIQAITDCEIWVGKYDVFQNLFHSMPEFREFGRAVLVNEFIAFKERTISMINEKAELRYDKLLNENKEIFQHVPLKYIASYLGITDTSLSRLRKDFSKR